MKGLILSGGNIGNFEYLKGLIPDMDFVLCADGGIRHAISLEIIPNAVIGDLDSVSNEDLRYIDKNSIPVFKYPVDKDKTDTELAIDRLIEMGVKDITITGATGTRMDHTLANIFLLNKLRLDGIEGRIIDEHNIIHMLDGWLSLVKKDYNISILPLTNDGILVSLKGFYYPLENERIRFGSTLGISNKIIEDLGTIHIMEGMALIIESID